MPHQSYFSILEQARQSSLISSSEKLGAEAFWAQWISCLATWHRTVLGADTTWRGWSMMVSRSVGGSWEADEDSWSAWLFTSWYMMLNGQRMRMFQTSWILGSKTRWQLQLETAGACFGKDKMIGVTNPKSFLNMSQCTENDTLNLCTMHREPHGQAFNDMDVRHILCGMLHVPSAPPPQRPWLRVSVWLTWDWDSLACRAQRTWLNLMKYSENTYVNTMKSNEIICNPLFVGTLIFS